MLGDSATSVSHGPRAPSVGFWPWATDWLSERVQPWVLAYHPLCRPQYPPSAASRGMAQNTEVWPARQPQASAAWPGTPTCFTRSCMWTRWAPQLCSAWAPTLTAGQHWPGLPQATLLGVDRVRPRGGLPDQACPQGLLRLCLTQREKPGAEEEAHGDQGLCVIMQDQRTLLGLSGLTLLGVPLPCPLVPAVPCPPASPCIPGTRTRMSGPGATW